MWTWIASLFGAAGLAALIWLAITRFRAQGARRAEIYARLEAARRLNELRQNEATRGAALDESVTAIAEAARSAKVEGPTRGALENLHSRTRKPWPPPEGE
jgi:transposase